MILSGVWRKINEGGDPRERLRFIVILCLVFSLPFDLFYSTALIGLLAVLTLIDLNKNKFKRIPRQVFLFQLVFFLAVAGYFYSFRKDQASFLMERQLSILLFPILLPLAVTITPQRVRLALAALTVSTLAALTYLFTNVLLTIRLDLKLTLIDVIKSGVFFNHQFSKPLGIHAGYFSLYVALAFFFVLYLANHQLKRSVRLLLAVALIYMATGLFFLASRNIILGSFLIIGFIYPFFHLKHKWRYMIIFALCSGLSFYVVSQIPYLNTRFSEELITDLNPNPSSEQIAYGVVESRFERWKAGWDLFLRSPLIGYGTGDEIMMLKTEYASRHLFISYLENYNAHNQYLSYLLKTGIIGLGIFVFAMGYYLVIACRNRDFLYISFLTLLVIGFYTENILDANKGIVFFAFFNTFFGYSLLPKKEEVATGVEAGPQARSPN